jgi:hypothetical protein
MVIRKVISQLLPALLLTSTSAFASFSMTLLPTLEVTQPGGNFDPNCFTGSLMCVFFLGTVTNLDPSNEIDFNTLTVTWDPSSPSTTALTSNDNFFLNSWINSGGTTGFPAFLAGGDSFTGILFEIDVPPLFNGDTPAPFGQYFGTATVDATDINSNPFEQAVQFEVDVVPEPAAWGLVVMGLAGIAAIARRRMRG